MTRNSRLNARLDAELSTKVEYLKQKTRATTTEVVRRSIERYYESAMAEEQDPSRVFQETGFLGCAKGPVDLSESYKDDLAKLLSRKS